MRKAVYTIRGMDCAEEVAVLKRAVGPVVGGEDRLSFDILNARMAVSLDAATASPEAVIRAVARTGMRAEPWIEGVEKDTNSGRLWQLWGRTILTAASGVFLLAGFLSHAAVGGLRAALGTEDSGVADTVPWTSAAFYSLGILSGVWYFLPKAWYALRHLRPDMNLLMTVAVAGAVMIGEWFEAATVAFLFALSLALESWSVGRARRAVAALMDLAPSTARMRHADGREEVVPPERVPTGAMIVIQPGERFPLDGRVVRGTSHVNQASITGESAPVLKQGGDEVFAGTINGDGVLEVECTKPAGDTTLANIIRMVGEAQSRRAPSEQWVERFARVYTPAVMALSLAVLVVPPVAFGGDWSDWLYRALVLLVIACPCALVISTPVTIVAALAAAARNGVLIKGGVYVEAPARLRAVALDKTGTLTAGHPSVVELAPLNSHDERELLERAAALEARSDHPIARAILDHARRRGVQPAPADEFRIIPGKGASGRIDDQSFWLGSHRFLEERGQETPEVHDRLEAMTAAGRSAVVVGNERHVCGLIALSDTIRPGAAETVRALRAAGIEHLIMLTGDNRGTAEAVAREIGIDEVMAELLPGDKVAAVEALVGRYRSVAMVGDGINDAPAMGRSTVGIAMGAAGSDAAIEAADVALMSDDLTKLPWLVRHARRALAVIRQNIFFSLGVKAVFVALTIAGSASLWAAIAADMGASLLVVFNGLRLLVAEERPQQTEMTH